MNIIKKTKFKIQSLILKLRLKKGGNFMICNPLRIEGHKNIEIGNNVFIQDKAWLAAPELIKSNPILKINDNTYIGDFAHFYAANKILIEESVLIANHVYITDNSHQFEDISKPIKDQPISDLGEVSIGAHSWIGEKVSILGVNIGKHCVIGANSVVTKDIPDYCIAVGIPAKIIKKFNFEIQSWENV